MTSHELAKKLLELEDLPVYHHYWYLEEFKDNGYDCFHQVKVVRRNGKIFLTVGEYEEKLEWT